MFKAYKNFAAFNFEFVDEWMFENTLFDFGQILRGNNKLNLHVQKPVYEAINGTPGDDFLSDTSEDDIIRAGDGNDRIYSSNGNDELYGENGDDIFDVVPNSSTPPT